MKIFLKKVGNAIPVIYDTYWRGKMISVKAWAVID